MVQEFEEMAVPLWEHFLLVLLFCHAFPRDYCTVYTLHVITVTLALSRVRTEALGVGFWISLLGKITHKSFRSKPEQNHGSEEVRAKNPEYKIIQNFYSRVRNLRPKDIIYINLEARSLF